MKFNLAIPIDTIEPKGEFQTPEAVREIAMAIEATRASACGLTEHPAPAADWLNHDPAGHDTLDPFTALAFVAAATSRIRLVTQIVVLPYRNPFLSAKSATTLQILSGGRFIFGVGAGYLRGEFEALGVPMEKRGALTDEALEMIRAIWAGGSVVKRGMYFNAAGNEQRPVPEPAPPIWVGGGSTKAMERAARWGDGWAPFFNVPTKDVDLKDTAVRSIADLAEKAKRLAALRESLGKTGPFDIAVPITVPFEGRSAGQAARYRDFLGEIGEAGATWATAKLPHATRAEFLDNLRWYDEEVMAGFEGE